MHIFALLLGNYSAVRQNPAKITKVRFLKIATVFDLYFFFLKNLLPEWY